MIFICIFVDETTRNPKRCLKNCEVINFNIIHNRCRQETINKNIKTYKEVYERYLKRYQILEKKPLRHSIKRERTIRRKKVINKAFTMNYTKPLQPGIKGSTGNTFGKRGKLHENMNNTVTVALSNLFRSLCKLRKGWVGLGTSYS